jgi:two-component system, response regulator
MVPVQAIDILLLDDNPQDIELKVRVLKKRNFANSVFVVEDGADALGFVFAWRKYRAADKNPRLALLDLTLPKLNGLARFQW